MNTLFDRQQRVCLVICTPIPTRPGPLGPVLDTVSTKWHRARMAMASPTNFNTVELGMDGLEVGDARSRAAAACLERDPRPEFCFLGGTIVEVAGGPKKIEDVVVGDMVRTHTGKYRPVTHVFRREYRQRMPLKWVHTPNGVIKCTPEHPFFVSRGGRSGEFVRARDLRPGDVCLYPDVPCDDELVFDIKFNTTGTDGTGKAGAVKNGKYLGSTPVTADLARFLGLYLAEGCGHSSGICFTFGNHESEHIRLVSDVCLSIFGRRVNIQSRWATNVKINVRPLGKLFRDWFGDRAERKRIPPFVFTWSLQNRLQFLRGYLDGDGSFDKKSKLWSFVTVSDQLAADIVRLSSSCGMVAKHVPVKASVSKIGDKTINSKESRHGWLSLRSCAKMEDLRAAKRMKDYLCVPIVAVEDKLMCRKVDPKRQCVYNLEVADENSYIADSVAVHNCLFIDYDVLLPPDTLTKLFFRARTLPNHDIYCGVYCCKGHNPPDPLIYGEHGQGTIWDWAVGDLLTTESHGVRSVHMGLTLIRVSAFEKLKDSGLVGGDGTDQDDRPFFRTTQEEKSYSKDGASLTRAGTEDIYFCDLLMKAGGSILVDTSVLAGHEDKATGAVYGLPYDRGGPVGRARWGLGPDGKRQDSGDGKIAIDLGAGSTRRQWDGYRTYTLDARRDSGADYVQDLLLLNLPDDHYDLVASSHAFEHVGRWNQEQVWKEAFRVCKPGGRLEVVVPNVEWAARKITEGTVDGHVLNVLYGAQESHGYDRHLNTHYFGYTPKVAVALAEQAGFQDVTTEDYTRNPDLGYNLVIRGVKPGGEPSPVAELVETNPLTEPACAG